MVLNVLVNAMQKKLKKVMHLKIKTTIKLNYQKILKKDKNSLYLVRDPIYKSVVINLLINHFMREGNKAKSEKIIYNSFKYLK
jgi:ribosomal protein S8E